MATHHAPFVPLGEEAETTAPNAVPRPWQRRWSLSSWASGAERFLSQAGYDRGPWLVVAFMAGIATWFMLPDAAYWSAALATAGALAVLAWLHWRRADDRALLRIAAIGIALAFAGGITTVWTRSALVGTPPIERPMMGVIEGRVLDREEQPAGKRVRVTLAIRDAATGRAIKVRVNVPEQSDQAGLAEGASVRMGVRLLPPAPPLLPGSYDFARKAWFDGLAATGASYGPIVVTRPAQKTGGLGPMQRALSAHVRARLAGAEGSIAAAFASGDRGAIPEADEIAMRDAGLTHLLSISGLHVSAVIGGAYVLAMRILALWPWLALRVRLPVVAAMLGALAGSAYTLLTGADVPTVRSCLGAGLVLLALVLGREPLSLRIVAVVAGVLLLLWPESLVGPSFQMSFCAVVAIVALHSSAPVRRFLAPREESWAARAGRRFVMLLVTGLVIEAVMTPIVLFHFHRAGLYGALANVAAIPLVTFLAMPLIALALLLDVVGLGAPAWWLAGQALAALLWLAHFVAGQAGAVRLMPQIGMAEVLTYVAGMIWLALWTGRTRLLGLVPAAVALAAMAATPSPDVLIARDGRQVGIPLPDGRLAVLRDDEGYALDSIREAAAAGGTPVAMANAPDADCNQDFCRVRLRRGDRYWIVLVARGKRYVEAIPLLRACEASDIVIAARTLPRKCTPRWLKADRPYLQRNGGLALHLDRKPRIVSVAEGQGRHGWWRQPTPAP